MPRVLDGRSASHKVSSVVRVASGNFLEMYDFQIFGYYAGAVAGTFFPNSNEYTALLATLATFGAGFLMRPIGGLVLGGYIDHHGRRQGLLLTLGLMAVGTLSIACTPSFAAIGIFAPLLVLAGRLVQGLSAGAENGGVSIYLYEIATKGHEGFFVSWQTASQQFAVITAALFGLILTSRLSAAQMSSWGWRVPLLGGCLIVPLLFVLRRSLAETSAFAQRSVHPGMRAILSSLLSNWRLVVLGIMLVTTTSVYYYMITAYTPTFGTNALHLPSSAAMTVTLCVGCSNLVWLPIMGHLSDRIGRRSLLLAVAALTLLTAYPSLSWLAAKPSFVRLLIVELWFSFMFSSYTGAMVVFLTEIMPSEVRTTGFSFAYSCATAAFGGFTPAISTYLIHVTGDTAAPGFWLSLVAILGLLSAGLLSPNRLTRLRPVGTFQPAAVLGKL